MSATNPTTGVNLQTSTTEINGVDSPVIKSQVSALPTVQTASKPKFFNLSAEELTKLNIELSKNTVMILTGYQKATNAYAHHLAASNDERGLLIDPKDYRKASKHLVKCIKQFKAELTKINQFKKRVSDRLEGLNNV